MPIRPEDRGRYPRDWRQIRAAILERAESRCECRGECDSHHSDGRCSAPNGAVIVRLEGDGARWAPIDEAYEHTPETVPWGPPIRVVLTIAHLDHAPEHCDPENLLALCQRCHLRLDRDHHAETARRTRASRSPQTLLPGVDP